MEPNIKPQMIKTISFVAVFNIKTENYRTDSAANNVHPKTVYITHQLH